MSWNRRQSFTLVEVMVVMVIISILTTITVSVYSIIEYAQKSAATEGKMNLINQALEAYKSEYKFYYRNVKIKDSGSVETYRRNSSGILYFNPRPSADSKIDTKGVKDEDMGIVKFCSRKEQLTYMEDSSHNIKTFLGEDYVYEENPEDPAGINGIRDGWGNLFRYKAPGKYNNTKYDLWSPGPDGQSDYDNPDAEVNKDDINNWN